jgi:diaminohydroxyphosphoribosylaminopyrimidine deaminase/5-amino-6-(5-phosphoribosylamino)uracil reductase
VRRLRDAGLDVREGILGEEARRLNAAFEHHITAGTPFVVWKVATSLDGKTAAHDGTSRWITSPEARTDAHRLRAWADAVIVGAGTVLADDPQLTVRADRPAAWQPMRVVLDAAGRVDPAAAVFRQPGQTLVATTERAEAHIDAWQAAGADVAIFDADPDGMVPVAALVRELGKRDVQGALLEGGATLAWSFLRAGLVDRVVQYLAPRIIGGAEAPGAAGGTGFAPVGDALDVSIVSVDRVGPDLRVEADVHRDR